MATVEAPNREFAGTVAGVSFKDGTATTEDSRALAYFRRKGYTVNGETQGTVEESAVDARDVGFYGHVTAPWSKDAAVDKNADGPVSDAWLPPTNAGEADPHGPLVVSPGLHGVPPAPITPGPVHVDDLPRQEAIETAVAEAVLGPDSAPNDVSVPLGEGDRGPLGLSDPLSGEQGRRDADGTTPAPVEQGGTEAAPEVVDELVANAEVEMPARSASKAAWVDYAVAKGADRTEAEALKRDELVDRYGES